MTLIKSALGEMARVALTEPFMLAVERQEIFLRRLPKTLDGFRIVHLSDFHYGPFVDSLTCRIFADDLKEDPPMRFGGVVGRAH